MKYFMTLAAFAGSAFAEVFLSNSEWSVSAGKPFEITWSDAAGPVTLVLKNGPSTDLQTVSTIASGLTGDSFTWTPPASLSTTQYAIEITDGTTTNYGSQFSVSGATGSASTSASASSTASSSATTSATMSMTSTASTTSSASMTASTSESSTSTRKSTTSTQAPTSTPPPINGAAIMAPALVAPIVVAVGAALF